jgi:hypothetical protein
MGRWVVSASCLAFVVVASAQTARGTVTGVVSYGGGAPVSDAPIQVRNKTTGSVTRAVSTASGAYTINGLPEGTYQLSIAMPCCAFEPFTSEITVRAGQTTQFDVRLVETLNGQTLGDDPGRNAAMIRRRSNIPSQPVPRLGSGKPDLSGVWLINTDLYPEPPDALPWVDALAKEWAENNLKDHPHTRCLPGDLPVPGAASPWIAKFVHTPSLLVILFEDVPGFRQIFLDGRRHPLDPNPTWMGHSVGKWEGDTLVVDTVGFNETVSIRTHPHTERLHMIERYRRVDFGHLENRVTFEDPGAFRRPWTKNLIWDLAPQEELLEFVCENNKPEHIVGK